MNRSPAQGIFIGVMISIVCVVLAFPLSFIFGRGEFLGVFLFMALMQGVMIGGAYYFLGRRR